ncbi:cytochrome P450 4C1-like [Cydia fagiglandana]|uniref:cytochrome P450 4C1-like n=1 Tax=Cydia fagiglandana TaxID=1458189 RepID=UPI002FEE019B
MANGNYRQEFHSENSPKHPKPEDQDMMNDLPDSPASRFIHFNVDSQKKIRRYFELASLVPTFTGHLPLIGHLHKVIGGSERFWEDVKEASDAAEKSGGITTLWVGPKAIFSETAVGISLDDQSVIDSEYKKAIAVAFEGSAQRLGKFWLHPDFLYQFSGLRKRIEEAVAVIRNMSKTVFNKRRAEREQTKLATTSSRRFLAFLDLLLDLGDEGSFTDEQILRELDVFIAAGLATSARVLVSVMVFIGTYTDVQDKLYEEIISVLGPSSYLGKEDMSRLVYAEAVIKEALRLSPVIPVIGREVDKDIKLKNYTLPAGSGCAVVFWGIHRLPIWGADRLQFRPERWLEPSRVPSSPGAFCGFSLGRRNCIGKPYAYMVVKTMLVHLVRKYRVSADYSKVKLKFDLVLKYGQHISLQLRE